VKRLTYILAFIPVLLWSQYTISGTFTPAEDFKWVILYRVTPETSIYLENKELDANGGFEITLDSLATSGMYRIVYAVPQEEYNFDIIYSGKEDVSFNFNSETGVEFISSSENELMESYTYNMGLLSQAIGEYFRTQSNDTLALKNIFKAQEDTQTEFERIAKGTIAGNFIHANRPYIPDSVEDIQTYIANLKTHFFENVDIENGVLQSSNFLVERVLNYVFGMTSPDLDENQNYIENIAAVIEEFNALGNGVKTKLLMILWQQFADTNNETIANHIGNNYLMPLANEIQDEELINVLNTYKSLSIGEIAPDFALGDDTGTYQEARKLSELKEASKYVVLFWSSSCGHCLEELPLLYSYLEENTEKNIKVVAVGLEENSFRWRIERQKYPNFIHVLGLGKWDNEIGNNYNVTRTPTYFLLDADKKITAKPIDIVALKELLDSQK